MKKYGGWWGILLVGCAVFPSTEQTPHYRVNTQRQTPYYLSVDADKVQDTCPQHNILQTFNCSKEQEDGFTCFDVYMVQGRPTETQRYSLIQQITTKQQVTAQPPCPEGMQPNCDAFLKALNYNLEFSWYLVNFPSSSFAQCGENYDCKRIDCYLPVEGEAAFSMLISCVYKSNQIFFVGSEVTCQKKLR